MKILKGMKAMTNSRSKGCRGEVELAKELGHYGINAIRGQQRYGSAATPDVIHNLPAVHFEVKWNERIAVGSKLLENALVQAIEDCPPDKMACVAWKKSRGRWHATFLFNVYPNRMVANLPPSEVPVTMDLEHFMYARGYPRGEESVYVSPKQDPNPQWLQQMMAGTSTEDS